MDIVQFEHCVVYWVSLYMLGFFCPFDEFMETVLEENGQLDQGFLHGKSRSQQCFAPSSGPHR
jgi:hypothetical protein